MEAELEYLWRAPLCARGEILTRVCILCLGSAISGLPVKHKETVFII